MNAWMLSASELTHWVNQFMLPFIRVSAMVSVAPIIGGRLVPTRVKLVIAFLATLLIAPGLSSIPEFDPVSVDAVKIICAQILIGLVMGFVFQVVFNAISIAGENIAMTMGLGFAQIMDPQNGVQVPVVSQFLIVVATLLFFSMDGHLALIAMIHSSFIGLPVSVNIIDKSDLYALLLWSGKMFSGAVLIALPAIISLLIVNVTMGIMTRAAPQLNIFSVGFPVTILIGFAIILAIMPGFSYQFSSLFSATIDFLDEFIAGS